jgi:hypothetical protein
MKQVTLRTKITELIDELVTHSYNIFLSTSYFGFKNQERTKQIIQELINSGRLRRTDTRNQYTVHFIYAPTINTAEI